jgi:hypothetical protein
MRKGETAIIMSHTAQGIYIEDSEGVMDTFPL